MTFDAISQAENKTQAPISITTSAAKRY